MQQRAQTKAAVRLLPASTTGSAHRGILLTAEAGLRGSTRERLALGRFVRILLPLIHLLLKLLCLLFICKAQTCKTILQLESVEERAVLVVGERVVDLLVP
jgi:hypothetical protein